MAKRIVFCADGTWQEPVNNTNVYKFYKALAVTADQIPYYDDGVGADAKGFNRFVDGAIGAGLLAKITAAYTTIAHAYEEGDELFLFGFSRGAYTARCLAGFIATCGLPSGPPIDSCVAQAFAAYRDPANRAALLSKLDGCGLRAAAIRMVGVWDTVGALGIPAIFGGFDERAYGFLDTNLHPCVQNAYQCLAVDEQRRQFPATLWTSEPATGQTLEQVWFAGCHGDIGGGTPLEGGVDGTTRLCDITLGWMMAKALALGLTMDPAVVAQYSGIDLTCALDKYIDSWTEIMGPPLRRKIPSDARISNSASVRLQYDLGSYAPSNLVIEDGVLGDGYTVVEVLDASSIQ